jgi:phage-related tail protein
MSIDQVGSGNAGPETGQSAYSEQGGLSEQAKSDFGSARERLGEDAASIRGEAETEVKSAAGKAKSFAEDQKDLVAEQMTSVADAVSKVAEELAEDQPAIARYAREIASGLSRVGTTVADKDVDDLMHVAQDFGRQQPLAFLGAALVAGFSASRFVGASAHRSATRSTSGAVKTPAHTQGADDVTS